MFRFTIRDVLWLMVVVGLGITCCVERERRLRVVRYWIAIDKQRTTEQDHLDREIRALKQNLQMELRHRHQLERNYDQAKEQLVREVEMRLRLTRELERKTKATDSESN
jgi:hypothetical protein